jgi:hypothetical protein
MQLAPFAQGIAAAGLFDLDHLRANAANSRAAN